MTIGEIITGVIIAAVAVPLWLWFEWWRRGSMAEEGRRARRGWEYQRRSPRR
jgi:hypothetical protein